MRLTTKKIEEILVGVLGEPGLPLIKELSGKDNVSEFDLAKKTKLDIKIVRKMLYLLYNHNLVSFNRKKDKIKGWYIYYWTLIPESVKFSYLKLKKNLLEKLNEQLYQEQKELFFQCPKECVRLNFDHAMDFEFHCPECGSLLDQDDSKKMIEILEKKIADTKEEINELIEIKKAKRKALKARKKEIRKKKKEQRKNLKKQPKISKNKPKKKK
jgi:transcription initiation factor TFIIE subunit alpha